MASDHEAVTMAKKTASIVGAIRVLEIAIDETTVGACEKSANNA